MPGTKSSSELDCEIRGSPKATFLIPASCANDHTISSHLDLRDAVSLSVAGVPSDPFHGNCSTLYYVLSFPFFLQPDLRQNPFLLGSHR